MCFFVNKECHKSHAKDVSASLQPGYISHSTTSMNSGMHTMIISMDVPLVRPRHDFSAAVGYKVDTISTMCFFVNKECHVSHAKDVAASLQPGYISHSTTSTKKGMHSIIVYRV